MASRGDGDDSYVTPDHHSSKHSTQPSFLTPEKSNPLRIFQATHRSPGEADNSPNVVPTQCPPVQYSDKPAPDLQNDSSDSGADDLVSESDEIRADSPKRSIQENTPEESLFVYRHKNIPAVKPLPQAQETHNGGSPGSIAGLPPFPPRTVDSRPPDSENSQDHSNHDSGYIGRAVTEESIQFDGDFIQPFEDMQKQYREGHTKDGMIALRLRVEAIQDAAIAVAGGATITLHDGSKVTQKELLSDMIDNQLLLNNGKPPYCVLCSRKKAEKVVSMVCVYCGWVQVSTYCLHCRTDSVEHYSCTKCGKLRDHYFSISSSPVDCQCQYVGNFKCCTKQGCKQLIEYTSPTSVPIPCVNCECKSTESFLRCARCKELKDGGSSCANCQCTTPTIFIKCCTECKWLKELTSSDSESCVHCGCKNTTSFECCIKCTRTKASTIKSHAIPKCTLQALQEESDWYRKRPVIYSYKYRIAKKAGDVTWYILCSHCEHANDLIKAEGAAENLRHRLDKNPNNDVKIDVDNARLLLIAAAFDMYRGFMVNVDLFKELGSPCLAHPLLQTFYLLKRYCQNPADPPPDIYLFLLPSYDVSQDFDQKDQVHLLHDAYMRMIKFTRVVTAIPYSPEHSFLYTSFARLHFLLPLPCCQEELIKAMLARYPLSELYHPNLSQHLSQHQSTVLMLRNGQYAESFFPQLLYSLGYWAAKELEEKYVMDITLRQNFKITFQPNCGIINECDEDSRERPRMPQKRKQYKVVELFSS